MESPYVCRFVKHRDRFGLLLMCLVMLGTAACRAGASHALRQTTTRRPSVPPSMSTTAAPTTTTRPPLQLVAWTGPVAHLFFHTLVIHPELAFTHDRVGQGFRDWYVTVGEFRSILDQLYANGWTLVDIHRAVDGDVRVPEGRKPLVGRRTTSTTTTIRGRAAWAGSSRSTRTES